MVGRFFHHAAQKERLAGKPLQPPVEARDSAFDKIPDPGRGFEALEFQFVFHVIGCFRLACGLPPRGSRPGRDSNRCLAGTARHVISAFEIPQQKESAASVYA